MPSPIELWDQDEDFREYCKAQVLKALILFNKRPNQTNIVNHICGYHWKNVGFLAWKQTRNKVEKNLPEEIKVEVS